MPIEIPFNSAGANEAIETLRKLNRTLKTTEDRLKTVSAAYSELDGGLSDIADLAGAVSGPKRRSGGGSGGDASGGGSKKTAFEQWVSTMRFGNGKLSPLVGRTAAMVGDAMGLGASAVTALSTGLGMAALALQVFTTAVSAASAASQQYRDAWFSGGPGVGGALRAGSMFEGGIAGRAMSFQQAIQSGGAASAFAQNAGIDIVGGPFGDINYNKKYQMALADLAKRTPEDARRVAMAYGQPDMANIALLSKENQKVALDNAVSDENLGAMADFNFSLNETKRLSTELFRDILIPALSEVTGIARNLLDSVVWVKDQMKGLSNMAGVSMDIGSQLKRMIYPFSWVDDLRKQYDELKGQYNQKAAVEANTDATKELTRAMRENTNEKLGGGDRTQSAVPRDIPGWVYDDAEARKSIRTGMY